MAVMDPSLRPYSFAAAALVLVELAGAAVLLPSPAQPVARTAEEHAAARIEYTLAGDVLGSDGWAGLGRAELLRDRRGRPAPALRLFDVGEVGVRLGLREGDLVVAVDGAPVDTQGESLTRLVPRRAERWCLSLLRDVVPLERCFVVADAAPPASREEIQARIAKRRAEREARRRADGPTLLRRADLARHTRLADALFGETSSDVLVAVDEHRLDSTEGLARAWEAARTRPSFCARGLHRGKPFERCFAVHDDDALVGPTSEERTVAREDVPFLHDIDLATGLGRALLHRGQDGEFDGYRLSAMRNGSFLREQGLQNGDIVQSLDEIPLRSVDGALRALDALHERDVVTLRGQRRGSPFEIRYHLVP